MPARRLKIESKLMQIWSSRGAVAWILFPLALLFRLLTAIRRQMYAVGLCRSTRLPVPVIVVGNIFVGGTGKTPLTIWLVHALQQAGLRPGVVSRGYGATSDMPRPVGMQSSATEVGDEPVLIAQRTQVPVVVGRQRAVAAQALLAQNPEVNVIIADDGLQHYALQRDIEILLFDRRGVGNGWLLPAGPLREPATRSSDFIVVNMGSSNDAIPPGIGNDAIPMTLSGSVAERLREPSEQMPLDRIRLIGTDDHPPRIVAAAGIGNPARFFDMLARAGLVFDRLPLPDHFDFADNPFTDLDADVILITEKDAVKCRHIESIHNDPRVWVVPVTAHIHDALTKQILEKLRGPETA